MRRNLDLSALRALTAIADLQARVSPHDDAPDADPGKYQTFLLDGVPVVQDNTEL
jgi:hypothetical protein